MAEAKPTPYGPRYWGKAIERVSVALIRSADRRAGGEGSGESSQADALKAEAQAEAADLERAEIIFDLERTFRAQDEAITRQVRRAQLQMNVLQSIIVVLMMVCSFFWWQFGRVESKAKLIAMRMILQRSEVTFRTSRYTMDRCLQIITGWMKGVAESDAPPEVKAIQIENLKAAGNLLQMNALGYAENQEHIHAALVDLSTKTRIDTGTVMVDAITGKTFVLNDTPGVQIDEKQFQEAMKDPHMFGGLMASARLYSCENKGALPDRNLFDLDPNISAATGVAYALPPISDAHRTIPIGGK